MTAAAPAADTRSGGTAGSPSPLSFAYHRAVAPMLWMLVAIGTIELVVVHVLVSLWRPVIGLLLSMASALALGWLVWAILMMKRRPVTITQDELVMQVGTIARLRIPLHQVAGLRTSWDAAAVRHRSVLNLGLLAYPNVVVDLAAPRPGRRGITAIAHRLDDPVAFAAALER
ncbi:MAG: hypothetical protein ACK4ZY_15940, partial [Sphingomonas sp.]